MMMINKPGLIAEIVKNNEHVQYQCYHHNRGYCKFGEQCRFPHFEDICPRNICRVKECKKRHPKPCRNGQQCKFNKANNCAFKHESKQPVVIESELENKIKRLQEEINILKEQIKEKNHELDEVNLNYSAKIEALEEENRHLRIENIVMQKMCAELDESEMFYCDKCEFEIEKEDALETLNELYHINPCKTCNQNFDEEDELRDHINLHHIKSHESESKNTFYWQDCGKKFDKRV